MCETCDLCAPIDEDYCQIWICSTSTIKSLHSGMSVDRIHELTAIDKWFLHKLRRITEMEQNLANYNR